VSDKGFYEDDLEGMLEIYIHEYEGDRERYWNKALSEGDYAFLSAAFEQAERFAEAVHTGAETLVSTGEDVDTSHLRKELQRFCNYSGYANEVLTRIMQTDRPLEEKNQVVLDLIRNHPPDPKHEDSPLRLVWERLLINLANDAVGKIGEGTARMFKLYALVRQIQPSPATQKFLARLGRCYVWGFEPECIMLCRAVLDTAFRDNIADEICEKHCGSRRNRREKICSQGFTLDNRIEAAVRERIIDKKTASLAGKVRIRGNKAVHYQADLARDVLGTIRDTLTVLQKLDGVKGRHS